MVRTLAFGDITSGELLLLAALLLLQNVITLGGFLTAGLACFWLFRVYIQRRDPPKHLGRAIALPAILYLLLLLFLALEQVAVV